MYYDLLRGFDVATFLADLMTIFTFIFIIMPLHSIIQAFVVAMMYGGGKRTAEKIKFSPKLHTDWKGILFLVLFDFCWVTSAHVKSHHFKGRKWQLLVCMMSGQIIHLFFAVFCGLCFNAVRSKTGLHYVFDSVTKDLSVSGSDDLLAKTLGLFFLSLMFVNLLTFLVNFIPLEPFDGYFMTRMIIPGRFRAKLKKFRKPFLIIIAAICLSTLFKNLYEPILNNVCTKICDFTARYIKG